MIRFYTGIILIISYMPMALFRINARFWNARPHKSLPDNLRQAVYHLGQDAEGTLDRFGRGHVNPGKL